MKIKLTRINDDLALRAANQHNQSIDLDASPDVGGQNLGMRPMELLASALASCSSIDVLLIMKKKRIILKHFEVELEAHRKDAIPAIFESIKLNFIIHQNDPIELVQHAVKLSIEKYCSVAASLSPDIIISHEIKRK